MKNGFSLVELSIVLVILGLLVGGVLAGKSLIRASELRAGISESQKLITSFHAFRDRYFQLPGDLSNATSFWGAAAGDTSDNYTATCYATSSTTATCNGNANGQIGYTVPCGERCRMWQHLANAGLVEGAFIGVQDATNPWLASTGGYPATKLSSTSVWFSYYWGSTAGSATAFAWDNGNALTPITVPFSPAEAWNLDTKLDDGMPATGKLVATKGTATLLCTNRANLAYDAVLDAAAVYNLANDNKDCTIRFLRVM